MKVRCGLHTRHRCQLWLRHGGSGLGRAECLAVKWLIAGAADEDGWAAQQRETGKVKKYRASAESVGLAFHPAVFETFGRCGKLFKAWFSDMVAEAEDRLPDGWDTNWSARTFSAHFQQRISVALQRGNSEVVLQRARRDY